jgi:hypothetical protein
VEIKGEKIKSVPPFFVFFFFFFSLSSACYSLAHKKIKTVLFFAQIDELCNSSSYVICALNFMGIGTNFLVLKIEKSLRIINLER